MEAFLLFTAASISLDRQGNTVVDGGGFYTFNCAVIVPGENTFITNFASDCGGAFTVIYSTVHLKGSTNIRNNSGASGGAMYISDSTVHVDKITYLENNTAKSEGGAIYARESVVKFNGMDVFMKNSARQKGGAIYSCFTTLIFEGSSSFMNNSAEYGGGIYSESSNVSFVHHRSTSPSSTNCKICHAVSNRSSISPITFVYNTAVRGGAQYFDVNSNISLYQSVQVLFQFNYATEFGGAIYVADVLGSDQQLFPQQHLPFRSECFFHMLRKEQSLDLPLVFVNNTAGVRGSVLYGGLLDKCTFTSHRYTSALELFDMSTSQENDKMDHSISSDPTQLCFCNMSKVNCSVLSQPKNIYPGQWFEVSAVAIDQSGSAVPALIHTKLHSSNLSATITYETGENCTSRRYSATPADIFGEYFNTKHMNFVNQLELYPGNRSGNTIHLIINITFEKCPIGFEQSNFTGECICDHRIWQYTNTCNIDRQAILRNASRTFWLGISYTSGTPVGFIDHPYCPLDYCISETKYINLKNPDEQCDFNRAGLLCGKCKEGLSLVLGSSQCQQCSNNYLVLLVPFALAGVLLVIFLFLLHLTVTAGTLHGLIFYANIVEANHHIFLPQTSNNPASIFIAWLNLDLGVQTCFYNGMDAYAKAWLEFAFPLYIWVLMGFLVYVSHHSVTVTKLLGSTPVSALATLFLLSYAKILRTIISALSLTNLHYPHKNVLVWIHDANVSLTKYIPLALVALLFLLFLFLPYTLLLLLGQWLQQKSKFHLLFWVKNHKLKAILDTIQAKTSILDWAIAGGSLCFVYYLCLQHQWR